MGATAVEAFANDGSNVVAVSRRIPKVDARYVHLPVDPWEPPVLQDRRGVGRAGTHLVDAAVHEKPGLVRGWRDPDQLRTNLQMLHGMFTALEGAPLQHVTLLQGAKSYGVHRHPIRIPARERYPRDPHESAYWLQEDHLRQVAAERGLQWTILRPQLVVGPTYGVAMNLPPVIGAYAAICRATGAPFGFPGGAPYVTEAVDVRLTANAAVWTATKPRAWGEHFNLTNGEVFEWRDPWPALADELGVDHAPDTPRELSGLFVAHAATWNQVVAERGLRRLTLCELLGEFPTTTATFTRDRAEAPPPPASSLR